MRTYIWIFLLLAAVNMAVKTVSLAVLDFPQQVGRGTYAAQIIEGMLWIGFGLWVLR